MLWLDFKNPRKNNRKLTNYEFYYFVREIGNISNNNIEIGKIMNSHLFSLVRFENSSKKIIENLQIMNSIILLERFEKSPKKS